MVLLLCPLIEFKETIDITVKAAKHFGSLGIRCVTDEVLKPILGEQSGVDFLSKSQAESVCDIVVAIGGDGTILRVAQRAIALDKPLFGINTGRIGFLSAFDGKNIEEITAESLDSLIESERLLLDLSLKSAPDRHYYAVNDIVISKSLETSTIEVDVNYGNYSVGRIRADGIIVSTPTGSTAYSLSAGGPIIAPGVESILITPICPHSLFSRSFVLATKSTVTVTPSSRINNRGHISVDGVNVGPIDPSDCAVIRCSAKYLRLLRSEKRSFYDIIREHS